MCGIGHCDRHKQAKRANRCKGVLPLAYHRYGHIHELTLTQIFVVENTQDIINYQWYFYPDINIYEK